MVQTAAALAAYRSDVAPGLALADTEALERIQKNWALTTAPESGPPYDGPSLILCGRQDSVTGYEDQYALLPHYPRATYAVIDVAGQPAARTARTVRCPDPRVAAARHSVRHRRVRLSWSERSA